MAHNASINQNTVTKKIKKMGQKDYFIDQVNS